MTPAEAVVVRLIATGATHGEVAESLFISVNTVKAHVAHVFAKVGVSTRSELATRATTRGF
ncbi:MAG: response regulator transcription factor [Chloroflexi bacterium]|nr:MAG: response regulator transcription factor [Chloroflexota bacterium]